MAKLLLVDGDPVWSDVVDAFFRRHGFEMSLAANGVEAFAKVGQRFPDLILLDLVLSGVDGLELLEIFRRDAKLSDVPVIVVTSRGDVETSTRTAALGVKAHLVKSRFSLPELLEAVRRAIDGEPNRTSGD